MKIGACFVDAGPFQARSKLQRRMIGFVVKHKIFAVFVLSLAGCASNFDARKEAQAGDYRISWREFPNVASTSKHLNDVTGGEKVYMFVALHSSRVSLSNGQTVSVYGGDCTFVVPKSDPKYIQLHNECALQVLADEKRLGLSEFIRLSETAVRQEGSCVWVGYDRGLDLRVRSIGKLAAASDERLFFAKLKCTT